MTFIHWCKEFYSPILFKIQEKLLDPNEKMTFKKRDSFFDEEEDNENQKEDEKEKNMFEKLEKSWSLSEFKLAKYKKASNLSTMNIKNKDIVRLRKQTINIKKKNSTMNTISLLRNSERSSVIQVDELDGMNNKEKNMVVVSSPFESKTANLSLRNGRFDEVNKDFIKFNTFNKVNNENDQEDNKDYKDIINQIYCNNSVDEKKSEYSQDFSDNVFWNPVPIGISNEEIENLK